MSGLDPNADTPFAEGLEPAEPDAPEEQVPGDFAEGLAPAEPTAPPGPPRLAISARVTADKDPAAHANVLKMADYTGLPRDVVERNPAEVKAVVAQRQVDTDAISAHSPALAEWLSHPDNMAIAKDDIKALQGLEWWTGRWNPKIGAILPGFGFNRAQLFDEAGVSRAVTVGMVQREQAEIGWDSLLRGADPDANPRTGEIDSLVGQDYGKESHGVLGRAVASTLEQVGPMGSALLSGAAMGAMSGSAAMAAGPGAVAAVPLATSAGTFAGIGYDTMKQEAGAAYIENIRADRERGVEPNYRSAAVAASIAGVANAAIEIGGSKLAVAFLPFLGPLLSGAKTAGFGGMTLKKAVARSVAGYVGTLLEESSTEAVQRGVTELTTQIRGAIEGAPTDFGSIPTHMGEEFVGALWGMALFVLPGGAGQLSSHLGEIRDGKRAQAHIESLGSLSELLKMASHSPEALAAVADNMAQTNQHPESVHVSADAWTTLFQGKGMDPAAQAAQIGVGAEYANAKETGGFIAIPFGTYVSQIAPNAELNSALAPDAKFYQEGMTGREAQEHQKVIAALADEMGEESKAAESKSPIYKDRFNQLRALEREGRHVFSETDADHYARLHEAFFKTQAARTGLTVEELSSVFPLSIQAGEIVPPPGMTVVNGVTTLEPPPSGRKMGVVDKFLTRFGVTPRETTITLGPTANPATFLNESGHYFLNSFTDLAYRDGAAEQTTQDMESLLTWFGVKTRDEITTDHHEKFAVAFEKYLEEGKAPSLGLVRTFARFAAWLKSLYRGIIGRGGNLSPEVRAVMDRMIATDDQIQNVTMGSAYIPMFRTAEEAGMTEDGFAAYNAKAELAHAEDQAKLNGRIALEQRRETEAWWKEERAKVEEGIAATVNAERPVQAYRYFADGTLPEGADPKKFADENGEPYKLSLKDIDADFPGIAQTVRKELGRTGLAAKGGAHPDEVAPLFGYGSGSEMLQALVTMEPPNRRIARETRNEMIARHGDILHDGTLPQVTAETMRESKTRLGQLLEELDALNHKAGYPRVKLTAADLEASAFKSIREGKYRDLNPTAFRQAESTAATNAIKANKKGKYDQAVEWQRRRLLNFALSREAVAAKKEAEAAAKFLGNSGKPTSLAKLGKAGGTHQDQVIDLLDRFDFRKRSLKDIDRSQSLQEWVIEQEAKQLYPAIPKKLLNEAFKTNWKDMSVNDLLDLRDAVKNIQHQAKVKNTLILAGKDRAFDAHRERGLQSLRKHVKDPGIAVISETLPDFLPKVLDAADRFDKFNVKIEELALQMDGEDANGPFAEVLVHALADSQGREKTVGLGSAAELLKQYQALNAASLKLLHDGEIKVERIKQRFTYKDLLGFAYNYGNNSNYTKMLEGYQTEQGNLIPWIPNDIEDALRHLTEAHWDYVQEGGDLLQSFWEESRAVEMRTTGIAPPEIERRPFTREFTRADGTKYSKTYEGYYYPLIPHPKFAKAYAERHNNKDGGPFESSVGKAITPHSFLIERTGATYPISFNSLRMPGHIASVVHDMTHREAIDQAWRYITDPEMSAEIKHRMGVPAYETILERLRRVANARGMVSIDDTWLVKGKAGLAATMMGFKVTIATQNFSNVGIAVRVVGKRAFLRAAIDIAKDREGMIQFIKDSDPEMEHRMTTMTNETRLEYERAVVGESWNALVARFGYIMSNFTNAVIDYPMWFASYRNNVAEMGHEKAARKAGSDVRTNIGAGGVKDLSAYQDSPVWKHLSLFTGWFSTQYNAQRRVIRETRGLAAEGRYIKAARHFAMENMYRIVWTSIMGELLSGRGPDDGEDAWEWALTTIEIYSLSLVPGIREVVSAVDRGGDVRFGGAGMLGNMVRDLAEDAWDAAHGEGKPEQLAKDAAKLAAIPLGLPYSQTEITAQELADLATGKEEFGWHSLKDLLFRRDKKRRR